jgi:hypothetical protein
MACKGLERKHRNESHQHQSNRKKSFAGFHEEQTFLFLIVPSHNAHYSPHFSKKQAIPMFFLLPPVNLKKI